LLIFKQNQQFATDTTSIPAYSRPNRPMRLCMLRKIDAAGRPVRQIDLCNRHAQIVITRELARGFEI
jgi:hypothetical protein